MSSTVVRIGAVVLALVQFGVLSCYAPAHRLLHHTLRQADAAGSQALETNCHSGCCHRHSNKSDAAAKSSSDESARLASGAGASCPTTGTPCPDDESRCVLCAIALQLADPATPVAEVADFVTVTPASAAILAPVVAHPATAFDVRGPPTL